MDYGCQSMTGKIEGVIIKHPANAFISREHLARNWREFRFTQCPDFEKTLREFEAFEQIIKDNVPEVLYLPKNDDVGMDSIYTHDPVKITAKGAVLMNMGKAQRANEPDAMKELLEDLGVPILGAITGDGLMEGGDVVLLNAETVIVGQGYRTNDEGIRQFKELTEDLVDTVMVVPLPHGEGPHECLHLMSIISMIDTDLAAVYSRYMPVFFRNFLLERGIQLVEVKDAEFQRLGSNILTLAPRKVLMLEDNPKTRAKLEEQGVEVLTYAGAELSLKGTGGPTCLTCPIHRVG